MKPTFIGIGAQKCASTWIFAALDTHPEVFMAPGKELDYFTYFYNQGRQWYEAQFDEAGEAGQRGEISPSYFCESDAAPRAAAYAPDLKIIVALRDPVERAYSNHLMEVYKGHFSGTDLSFEAGLANNPMYLEQSRYGRHIARWLDHFPRQQIHIILQEDLKTTDAEQMRALYAFLGVDAEFVSPWLGQRNHVSEVAKNETLARLMRTAGDGARALGLAQLVADAKSWPVISQIRSANTVQMRDVVPPMSDTIRDQLQAEFAEDIRAIAQLIGRESLPWPSWKALSEARLAS